MIHMLDVDALKELHPSMVLLLAGIRIGNDSRRDDDTSIHSLHVVLSMKRKPRLAHVA